MRRSGGKSTNENVILLITTLPTELQHRQLLEGYQSPVGLPNHESEISPGHLPSCL